MRRIEFTKMEQLFDFGPTLVIAYYVPVLKGKIAFGRGSPDSRGHASRANLRAAQGTGASRLNLCRQQTPPRHRLPQAGSRDFQDAGCGAG
jgi:hypothetical protein